MLKLFLLSIAVFVFNIPFGYWRANVKKFSLQWALAIHLPIPVIILIRIVSNVGFGIESYAFFVSAFFLGQLLGKKLFQIAPSKFNIQPSSCLAMDLIKLIKH